MFRGSCDSERYFRMG